MPDGCGQVDPGSVPVTRLRQINSVNYGTHVTRSRTFTGWMLRFGTLLNTLLWDIASIDISLGNARHWRVSCFRAGARKPVRSIRESLMRVCITFEAYSGDDS